MGESCQAVKREKNMGMAVPILTENLSNTIIQALLCFQTQVANLDKVKKVAYRPKGQVITIWTYALPDDKTLEKIYSVELKLIELFPNLTFDFTVIFDVDSDIPTGFIPAGIV